MDNLFTVLEPGQSADSSSPLADRMRPSSIDEMVGQPHLLGPDSYLRHALSGNRLPSLIFWGPPGVGKTTLARLISGTIKAHFVGLSAVLSGLGEIRQILQGARKLKLAQECATILFVDEIHRFSKNQQDAFLPYVEDGSITLLGATTENPSFELTAPLLSRCRVLVLKALDRSDLCRILQRALADPVKGLGEHALQASEQVLASIAAQSGGDARNALNILEQTAQFVLDSGSPEITIEAVGQAGTSRLKYDKKGEVHFDSISAFQKSIRNSDVDAAIYWLTRMLEGGEDPLYIARRMVRCASEDIGLADFRALEVALSAKEAAQFVGMPECSLCLAQAAIYLAQSPKSNAVYKAYSKAHRDVLATLDESVPLHLRNATTELARNMGYAKGYQSAHDQAETTTDMECLPTSLRGTRYYEPKGSGEEDQIRRRLQEIESQKQQTRVQKTK